jgi:DNA-binding transcriptional LysR family regulator
VLPDIDDAERSAGTGAARRGRVRINANVPFGLLYLFPLLASFHARARRGHLSDEAIE